MLRLLSEKGFQMTFENGVTINVKFSSKNYCDNRTDGFPNETDQREGDLTCVNAEIAIWKKNNDWITAEFTKKPEQGNAVAGWITTNEVADAIAWAKNYEVTTIEIRRIDERTFELTHCPTDIENYVWGRVITLDVWGTIIASNDRTTKEKYFEKSWIDLLSAYCKNNKIDLIFS
jgi:hypothetical protein